MANQESGFDNDSDVVFVSQAPTEHEALPDALAKLSQDTAAFSLPVAQDRCKTCSQAAQPAALLVGRSTTEEQLQAVRAAYKRGHRHAVDTVAQIGHHSIDGAGFRTLEGNSWLQDGIVNSYLEDVVYANLPASRQQKVCLLTTFFFTKLLGDSPSFDAQPFHHLRSIDYMAVRRWTLKSNPLVHADIIVVPVHENEVHWCLLVIDVPSRRIFYLDSMLSQPQYYSEKRARLLSSALFGWITLEAHSQGCTERVFGKQQNSADATQAEPNALDASSQGSDTASATGATETAPHPRPCYTSDSDSPSQLRRGSQDGAHREPSKKAFQPSEKAFQNATHDADDALEAQLAAMNLGSGPADTQNNEPAPDHSRSARSDQGDPSSCPHPTSAERDPQLHESILRSTKQEPSSCGWAVVLVDDLPRQQDASSCGLFMVSFAELVMRGYAPPYNFGQSDIGSIRTGVASVLLGLQEVGELSTGRAF